MALEEMVPLGESSESGAGEGVEPWYGNLTIERGTVILGKPVEVDVVTRYELRDSRPLLHLFLSRPSRGGGDGKVPMWARLTPTVEDLEGSASFDLGASGLVIDDLVATGTKTVVMARLRNAAGDLEGQLYLKRGIVSLGIGLAEGKKDMRFRKPRKWFLEQPEYDDSSRLVPPPSKE